MQRGQLRLWWMAVGALLFSGVRQWAQGGAAEPASGQAARLRMVSEYIEREGIRHPRVLQALRTVPRHEFVPLSQRAFAYVDAALPIGYQQTISPPYIVAYMTEAIDPQPEDKVLEIGTGSGYQAAVLAELVREVYTIEIVEPLGKQAAERLKRLGYHQVHVKIGDGYLGWPEYAPFDKIIVTCSPEKVPPPLVEQLREGGKMIIPLGERYRQEFHLLVKQQGELKATRLINTLFVPMTGASEQQRERQPDPLNPQVFNGEFELDENHDGYPDGWHYQRLCRLEPQAGPDGSMCVVYENEELGRPAQSLQGMAVDGRHIASLNIRLYYRLEQSKPGTEHYEKPALYLHFYDAQRRLVAESSLGPWQDTTGWVQLHKSVAVPVKTAELVLRIGLNGATGKLWVDKLELQPMRR
ncbi:MAG: protein-L-isoaspartate O-methyltransferase [Planctomycetaceae bacterium]|nr:MAG: protein-L-isoaspartate O-methyltransferase [Planctomycetaceae bacterium]